VKFNAGAFKHTVTPCQPFSKSLFSLQISYYQKENASKNKIK
jgi:hypothetical protein